MFKKIKQLYKTYQLSQELDKYRKADWDKVISLLEQGANSRYAAGWNALLAGIHWAPTEVVEKILKLTPNDINFNCGFSQVISTPLNRAIFYKREDLIPMLLNAGADCTQIAKLNKEMIWNSLGEKSQLAFLNAGYDIKQAVDEHGTTPIHILLARREASLAVTKKMITMGLPRDDGRLVRQALECGKDAIATLLIKAGFLLEYKTLFATYDALLTAARLKRKEPLEAILQIIPRNQIRGSRGVHALNRAIESNFFDGVRVLAEKGAPINGKVNGDPLITIAARLGRTDVVQYFCRAGANINAVDTNGNTAVMWMAYNGDLAGVKLLKEAKADMSLRNKNGYTAALLALGKQHVLCAEELGLFEKHVCRCAQQPKPLPTQTTQHTR